MHFKRFICCFLSFFCVVVFLFAQEKYARTDAAALAIPVEYTFSPDSLADYINRHFSGEEEKIRAVYIWMTHTLKYNVYTTFDSPNELPDEHREMVQTLRQRKGVCRQFARLFRLLAEKLGIPAYVVAGYNKNGRGIVLSDPHEWCTAKVNLHWYFFDPTYGMGYVADYRFVSSPNTTFFCRQAREMIRTHMPFDPLWQQFERPYSFEEFDRGTIDLSRNVPVFHWSDSLVVYARQTPAQRLEATYTRVSANGKGGPLVNYFLQLTLANIGSARKMEIHTLYKRIAELKIQATDRLELFLEYRKNAFRPEKPEREVRLMIEIPESVMMQADSLIHSVHSFPPPYETAIKNLRRSVIELSNRVFQQKMFIERYYATRRSERSKMFP